MVVRREMGIQTGLEEWDEENSIPIDMGKVVRDANYHMLQNDKKRLGKTCGWVLSVLLEHPKGLTDKEIVKELTKRGTYLPKSSVNGRRNDLKKMGYNIVSLDVKLEPDHNGNMHPNIMWGVVVK